MLNSDDVPELANITSFLNAVIFLCRSISLP